MASASTATNLRRAVTLQARLDRFTRKDPLNGCWIWTGEVVRDPSGAELYGRLHARRGADGEPCDRNLYAHRAAYEIAHGPIPAGLQVRHLCHQPLCVNPAHLAVGDAVENRADSLLADRGVVPLQAGKNLIELSNFLSARGKRVDHARLARIFGTSESAARSLPKSRAWARAVERANAGERGDQ